MVAPTVKAVTGRAPTLVQDVIFANKAALG